MTESMSNKMIPALIYKNEENEYEIDVYEFCNIRDIRVRDLYHAQTDPLKKLINDEMRSNETRARFISSIYIQPKSRVVKESSEVKIISQPTKKIIYKNAVEISRGFQAESLPLLKIITTNERTQINWKSSIEFDLKYD